MCEGLGWCNEMINGVFLSFLEQMGCAYRYYIADMANAGFRVKVV